MNIEETLSVFIDKYVDFEADMFNEIIEQIADEKGQWVLESEEVIEALAGAMSAAMVNHLLPKDMVKGEIKKLEKIIR